MTVVLRLSPRLGESGQLFDTGQSAWTGAGNQLLNIFLGLLGFVAIAVLLWFLLRIIQRKGMQGSAKSGFEVLARMPLTQTAYLMTIRVYGRCFLISVGKDSASLICEFDPAADGTAPASGVYSTGKNTQAGASKSFVGRFAHNLLYNAGLKETRAYPPEKAPEHTVPVQQILQIVPAETEDVPGHTTTSPTSVSKDTERSGQIGIEPKHEPIIKMDYNAAIERMHANAQVFTQVKLAPASPPAVQPIDIAQKEPAEAPGAEAAGVEASRTEVSVADMFRAEAPGVETPEAATSDFSQMLKAAQDSTVRQVPKQDELDVLFNMIADRREHMTQRRKRE